MKKSKKNRLLKLAALAFILLFLIVANQENLRKTAAEKIFISGSYYFNGGEYNLEKAKSLYKAALFFDSRLPVAHYQLGRIYFVENKLKEALKEIDAELSLNPDNQRSYYIRGLINGYSADFQTAIDDFTRFVAWAPKEWAGYNDLAWAYYQNGNYDKAKETALKGVELFPDNVWLLNGLGASQLALEDFSSAQDTLNKVTSFSDKLTVDDWIKSYPGNNPEEASGNLSAFKDNIYINKLLAENKIPSGAIFADACSSTTQYVCSGTSCIGQACDPDHYNCASSCSSDADCGGGGGMDCTPRCGECDQVFEGQTPSPGARICVGSACNYYDHFASCTPSCTPSCGACSVSCGGGTQDCVAADCTHSYPSCNTQACGGGCTPSCGACSVSCGGGTQDCVAADCTHSYPSCNTQACPPPGDCGNATNKTYCQKPTKELCNPGTASNIVADGNRWKWNCGSEPCYALKSCAYQEVSPN